MSATGPGCVKTRYLRVFRGLFTIPDLEKRLGERFERPSVAGMLSVLRFYTAWARSRCDYPK